MARLLFIAAVILVLAWLVWQFISYLRAKKQKPSFTILENPIYNYNSKSCSELSYLKYFQVLTQALTNYLVVPNLTLASFLTPNEVEKDKAQQAFLAIANEAVDFAILDNQFNILAVVEITDYKADIAETNKKYKLLKANKVAIICYSPNILPSQQQVIQDFNQIIQKV